MKTLPKQITDQLRVLSGNALKVILTARLLGGIEIGNKEIKMACGLSYPTIKNILETQLAYEGLIVQEGRYNSWTITSLGCQLLGFDRKSLDSGSKSFFDSPHSSSIKESLINNDLNNLNTTIIQGSEKNLHSDIPEDFEPSEEMTSYLKSRGVWNSAIKEIASLCSNDLDIAEAYFEGIDTALACWQIRNGKPPSPDKDRKTDPNDFRRYSRGKYAGMVLTGPEDDFDEELDKRLGGE